MRAPIDLWTCVVWRILCLLTLTSAAAAVTGLLFVLPTLWQGLAVAPGLLVTLLYAVASWADSSTSSAGR